MALFLPVIVSKKNKQTEKNMSFIAVYHKFIGLQILKKHEKPHHNDCLNVGLPTRPPMWFLLTENDFISIIV